DVLGRRPRRGETASEHPLRTAMLPSAELNEAGVLRGAEHLALSALGCRFDLGTDRAGQGARQLRRVAADLFSLEFHARLGRLKKPCTKLDRSSHQPALQPLAADDRHLHGGWHQFSTIVMRCWPRRILYAMTEVNEMTE